MKKLRNIVNLSKLFSGTDVEYDTKVDFTKVQIDTEELVTKTNLLDEAMDKAIDDRATQIMYESIDAFVLGLGAVEQTKALSDRFTESEFKKMAEKCKENDYDISYLKFSIADYPEAHITTYNYGGGSITCQIKNLSDSQIIDRLLDTSYSISLPIVDKHDIYKAFSGALAEKIKEERNARVD